MDILNKYIERSRLIDVSNSNINDFMNHVDVVNYDDIYPHIEKLYNTGEGFINDEVIYWAYTSGTSSNPKKIPITKYSLEIYRDALAPLFKKLSEKYANEIFKKDSFLPIVGKYKYDNSPNGIPVGCISGLTIYLSYQKYKPFMVYDYLESDKLNLDERWELIRAASAKSTIRWMIVSNPLYIYELIKLNSGEKNPNHTDAKKVWPHLKVIITMTGGSNKPYIDKLKELFPETEIWDAGIGASEGYYVKTIFKPEPIGHLCNNHYHFEFLSINENYNVKNTKQYSELKDDEKYQLIITTPNGFIRYNTQDILMKKGNLLKYVGRNDKTYSFVGERITEIQIEDSLKVIEYIFNFSTSLYKIRFVNNSYEFLFFTNNHILLSTHKNEISEKLDTILKQLNINYLYAREMYKVLKTSFVNFYPIEYYYSEDIGNIGRNLLRQEKQSILIG